MFFESQINSYNFRYDGDGDGVIEVSRVGDRNRTVLKEIPVKNLDTEKKFHSEISFWFMEEGVSLMEG